MKIVISGSGLIDTAHAFMESSQNKKLLKKLVVLSRDKYYIEKIDEKIEVIDYSDISTNVKGTPVDIERDMLRKVRPKLEAALRKSGDVLFVATCEPAEMAALPILQDICRKNSFRFHALFIAPFLFQGKKQAELMKSMLNTMSEDYVSVSLYYADELLKLEENSPNVAAQQWDPYTMQNAFDSLEKSMVDIVMTMCAQIPKLAPEMQYTYNFTWQQFSLAVDPLKLLLDMWYSILNDEDLFPEPITSADIKNVLDEEAKVGGTGKLARLIGVLNPDRDKTETKSAYDDMHKNSIPLSVFKEQTGESRINEFVERIKTYVYTDGIPADPDIKKKAEEKLRREIAKFQVRQEKAEKENDGYQQTVILDTEEALSTLYMQEDPLKESEIHHDDDLKNMGLSTPFQRAARAAAQGREEEERRRLISEARRAGKIKNIKKTDVSETKKSAEVKEEILADVNDIKQIEVSEKKSDVEERLKSENKKAEETAVASEIEKEEQTDTEGVMDFTFKSDEDVRSRRRTERQNARINKRIARAEEKAAIAAAKAEKAKREVEIISRKKDM